MLARTGQTEGSVDLAKLSGQKAAAVIWVLRDDGTLASPNLVTFAQKRPYDSFCGRYHFVQIEYRKLVERTKEVEIPTEYGPLRALAFRSQIDGREALALVKGSDELLTKSEAPLVRVHSGDPLTDVFGGILDRGGLMLKGALRSVAEADCGVILYLKPLSLSAL